MNSTVVPILREEPLTFGAEHLALDGAEGEAWKLAVQAVHPRLLPHLKESALLSEEDSAFCAAGGIFDYQRGVELVIDGEQLILSHCAEHFLDFLMSPEDCLRVVEENQERFAKIGESEEQQARLALLRAWWERGCRVLILQHM